jgi:hypothetical protein
MTEMITRHKGVVREVVSRRTSYLVYGGDMAPARKKYKEAVSMQVKMLTEQELYNMVRDQRQGRDEIERKVMGDSILEITVSSVVPTSRGGSYRRNSDRQYYLP